MRYYKVLTLALLLFVVNDITAQTQAHTHFFDPQSKLTWLGLDFSEAKFVGGLEDYRGMKLPGLLKSWNDLLLTEYKKFNATKMLHRKAIDTAIDVTIKHNATLNLDGILTSDMKLTRHLGPDSIANIVATYDFGGRSGNGVMINVESFSKIEEMSLVWITFVDMDSKKVLFTRRLIGQGGGSGVRNYWANSIFRVMDEVRTTYYSQWSKRK